MIIGMSVAAFTLLHVIISLVGIGSGIVVVLGMLKSRGLPQWTALFLFTTVLTSVTGFMFHSAAFGPPHIVGVISLVVLAFAIAGLYLFKLAGPWCWSYVVTSLFALYLNVFVAVTQAFNKIPALTALSPTQTTEPAFVGAQGFVMVLFIAVGVRATKRFRPALGMPAHA